MALDVTLSDASICSVQATDIVVGGNTTSGGFGQGGFGDSSFGGGLSPGFSSDFTVLDARVSDLARIDVAVSDRQIGRVLVTDRT